MLSMQAADAIHRDRLRRSRATDDRRGPAPPTRRRRPWSWLRPGPGVVPAPSTPVLLPPPTRELTTVLFADIADSTGQVTELGDERWRRVLETFLRDAEGAIAQHRGRLRNVAGDGLMATFASPGAAVRTATRLHALARRGGFSLRCGVHSTEVEVLGGDIAGLGVHIAARVTSAARPGSTFVSRTVRDLVAGGGLSLQPQGQHELRGVDEPWELHAVCA